MKPPEILSLLEEASGTKMYEKKKQVRAGGLLLCPGGAPARAQSKDTLLFAHVPSLGWYLAGPRDHRRRCR